MKKIILLVVASVLCGSVSAQTVKLGKIKSADILSSLSEVDSADVKMKAYVKEMEEQYEVMTVEFNRKVEDYGQKQASMTDVVRNQKTKELEDMQARIQEFNTEAQNGVTQFQQSLMYPIVTKIQESVNKIAKASGYTLIIEDNAGVGLGTFAYIDQSSITDITQLVVKDLGGTYRPASSVNQAQ